MLFDFYCEAEEELCAIDFLSTDVQDASVRSEVYKQAETEIIQRAAVSFLVVSMAAKRFLFLFF